MLMQVSSKDSLQLSSFYLFLILFFSYSLKGPVYLKDKTGQVVTPHVKDDSVVFGPGGELA